ncbi:MAG: hypothetical protein ACKV2V_17455 [Blastocatellia bacterium]
MRSPFSIRERFARANQPRNTSTRVQLRYIKDEVLAAGTSTNAVSPSEAS